MKTKTHFRITVRYILLTLAIVIYTASFAQKHSPDSSYKMSIDGLKQFNQSMNERFLLHLKQESIDKKLTKYYETRFKEIFKTVNEEIDEGQMLSLPIVNELLDKIIAEIRLVNPQIPDTIQFLVRREGQPNAYTIGDHTIFIHLGLFSFLQNEDQVASVLSHEIGHILAKHTLKMLSHSYMTNEENKTSTQVLKQTQIKRADKAFELLKNSVYQGGKIKREHELEADSIGYALFKKTRYNKRAFIDALAIIEQNDSLCPDGLLKGTYQRFFDLPEQSFSDGWLQIEDFSSYSYNYKNRFEEDSIASHPKSKDRISNLMRLFPELESDKQDVQFSGGLFKEVSFLAQSRYLPNLYFNEQYGDLIYLSLLYLQSNKEDNFYKYWLGKGFQKIYEARRDYQLNKYLERINPKEHTESYIQFLSFMWNLKLDEVKRIADYYASSEKLSQ